MGKEKFSVHRITFLKCWRSVSCAPFDDGASKFSFRRAISFFFGSHACANAAFYGVGRFSSRLSLAVIEFAGFVFSEGTLKTFRFFVNEKFFRFSFNDFEKSDKVF